MDEATPEALFARYREAGDAQALAALFDRLAPELLLVAAHLTRRGVAEDIVQTTFLNAMRYRDRWDSRRPLAPWLIGILSNHIRESRRQQHRVPDPERLGTQGAQRPDLIVEANESLAAIHSAVQRLPRHYRQVLSLRLVHGMEQQQIAHSLGLPLGTVKIRLHRGTALLRRMLPVGLAPAFAVLLAPGRTLAAVREAVIGHANAATGSTVAMATGGLLLGGLLMKKALLAAAAILAVSGASWWVVDAMVESREPVAPAPPTNEQAAVASPSASTKEAANTSPPPNRTTAVAPQRTEAATTSRLAVRVRWASDNAPATHVDVRAYDTTRKVMSTRTVDEDGLASFDDLLPGTYSLTVPRATASAPTRIEVAAGASSTAELQVDGDQRLRVTVFDEDNRLLPDASVWFTAATPFEPPALLGRTGADGVCAYRGIPPRSVWARRAGSQPSTRHDLRPLRRDEAPPEFVDIRLQLGAVGCVLHGSVVGPDKRPIAEARVLIACDDSLDSRRFALETRTDVAGRFACDEVPAGERYVVAEALGLAPCCQRVTTSEDLPTSIVLVLPHGATLAGRVVDAAGQPAVGFTVTAAHNRGLPGLNLGWGSSRTTRTNTDGHYRLDAILPGEVTARVAARPGVTKAISLVDGEQQTWDVVLEPERAIHGSVLGPDGQPLSGWTVQVISSSAAHIRPTPHLARTDAGGIFRLTGLVAEAHRLFVFAPSEPNARRSVAAAFPRAVLDDTFPMDEAYVIRLDAAATASCFLDGSLSLPEDVRATARLSLYSDSLRGGTYVVPQEELEIGATVFRIGPLPAGVYDLICGVEGRGHLAHRGVRLVAGETLQLPPFAFDAQRRVMVKLRDQQGQPIVGATVRLERMQTPCEESMPGHYASPPVEDATYEVVARGPGFAPAKFAATCSTDTDATVHTVEPAATVSFLMTPATPRDRWVGAMGVQLTDSAGAHVVNDLMPIDGKQDFTWAIGLRPGTYSLKCSVHGDGEGSTTFRVGSEPLKVDLRLSK